MFPGPFFPQSCVSRDMVPWSSWCHLFPCSTTVCSLILEFLNQIFPRPVVLRSHCSQCSMFPMASTPRILYPWDSMSPVTPISWILLSLESMLPVATVPRILSSYCSIYPCILLCYQSFCQKVICSCCPSKSMYLEPWIPGPKFPEDLCSQNLMSHVPAVPRILCSSGSIFWGFYIPRELHYHSPVFQMTFIPMLNVPPVLSSWGPNFPRFDVPSVRFFHGLGWHGSIFPRFYIPSANYSQNSVPRFVFCVSSCLVCPCIVSMHNCKVWSCFCTITFLSLLFQFLFLCTS